jgi:hypothetical protein
MVQKNDVRMTFLFIPEGGDAIVLEGNILSHFPDLNIEN